MSLLDLLHAFLILQGFPGFPGSLLAPIRFGYISVVVNNNKNRRAGVEGGEPPRETRETLPSAALAPPIAPSCALKRHLLTINQHPHARKAPCCLHFLGCGHN